MIPPPRPQLPTANPRQLLAHHGPEAIAQALAATGYMIQRRVLDDFVQVLRSGKPWLLEGDAGAGKSAIAYACQQAFNMTLFPLQGMAELTLADILYAWDAEAQSQFVIQAVTTGAMNLREAQAAQYGIEFLKLGEALHAYHWAAQGGAAAAAAAAEAAVPLFLFDEVDKLPLHLQDMMLQLCECGYAHVPRYDKAIGIYDHETGATDRALHPLVIFTSNNLRHKLSEPFRSRCYYTWIDPPTLSEQVMILHRRVPEASPGLVLAIVKISESIKIVTGVPKKPGLRELIDLLQALARDRVTHIDERVLISYVGYLAKQNLHRRSLYQALGAIEADLEMRDRMLEQLVLTAFDQEPIFLEAA